MSESMIADTTKHLGLTYGGNYYLYLSNCQHFALDMCLKLTHEKPNVYTFTKTLKYFLIIMVILYIVYQTPKKPMNDI